MTFATRTLKEQACAAQAEIASRVSGRQGGVPTFFDNFLNGVVSRLKSNEALHGWNVKQQTLPTTYTVPTASVQRMPAPIVRTRAITR